MAETENSKSYWHESLWIVTIILSIWAIASFGCSIIFRDELDKIMPKIGNAPFGFWMSQQGSIIVFVLLLLTYTFLMNRLDKKHNFDEGEKK
jgi:putative solute:sodium symporter small subunit